MILFIRNQILKTFFNILVNSQRQAIVAFGILRHLGLVEHIFIKPFTKSLLYARCSSKHFLYIYSFNPNNNSLK